MAVIGERTGAPGERLACLGLGVMMHFGLATFARRTPWRYEPRDYAPQVYAPSRLDPAQWIAAAAGAGARYVCVTAKHHDGFAMWRTKTTQYGVSASGCPRDVMDEVAGAAESAGLALVVYYSWLDKSHPGGAAQSPDDRRGSDEYLDYVRRQLEELLTGYGPVVGVWLDVPPRQDARLAAVRDHVKQCQPDTLYIPNLHTDHRTADVREFESPDMEMIPAEYRGKPAEVAYLVAQRGNADQGWWQFDADGSPAMTVDDGLRLFEYVRGTGASLALNISPGPSGMVSPANVDFLAEFGHRRRSRTQPKE